MTQNLPRRISNSSSSLSKGDCKIGESIAIEVWTCCGVSVRFDCQTCKRGNEPKSIYNVWSEAHVLIPGMSGENSEH